MTFLFLFLHFRAILKQETVNTTFLALDELFKRVLCQVMDLKRSFALH